MPARHAFLVSWLNPTAKALMKYEVRALGHRLEAIGAHSGYRIRMSTLSAEGLECWPVSVHIRLTFRRSADAFARNLLTHRGSGLARCFQVDEALGLLLPGSHELFGVALVVDGLLQ